eukprot:2464252-Rhodomonas_salina.1
MGGYPYPGTRVRIPALRDPTRPPRFPSPCPPRLAASASLPRARELAPEEAAVAWLKQGPEAWEG